MQFNKNIIYSPDAPTNNESQDPRVRELLATLRAKQDLLHSSQSPKVADLLSKLPPDPELSKGAAAAPKHASIEAANAAMLQELLETDEASDDDPSDIVDESDFFSSMEDVSAELDSPGRDITGAREAAVAELLLALEQSPPPAVEQRDSEETVESPPDSTETHVSLDNEVPEESEAPEVPAASEESGPMTLTAEEARRLGRVVDGFLNSQEFQDGQPIRLSVLQSGASLSHFATLDGILDSLRGSYKFEVSTVFASDAFSSVSQSVVVAGVERPTAAIADQLLCAIEDLHIDYLVNFQLSKTEAIEGARDNSNVVSAPSGAGDVETTNLNDTTTESTEEEHFEASSAIESRGGLSAAKSLPGKTRARSRLLVALAASVVVLVGGGYVVSQQLLSSREKLASVEKHVNDSVENLVLVNVDEFERLKDDLDLALSAIESLKRNSAEQVTAAREDEKAQIEKLLADRIEKERRSGFEEGAGVKSRALDRVTPLSYPMAVVNGFCYGFGRGNRIDRIHTTNNTLKVISWSVNPENLHLTGVRGQIAGVIAEGYSEVECFSGESDVYPSAKEPVVGTDGRAQPVDESGKVQNTEPENISAARR